MDNKIIDINEWLRWVIKKHPSQKQITTIKKYWSCHTIKDYCIKFKNDIHKDIYDNLKQNNFETEWKDNSYSWDLDRLFDIQKFVKDCPQLSKVNIGYFAIQDTINSLKYKEYIQVIKKYNGDDYLEEEKKLCRYPFPMKNIKTEKDLDLYIKEQKKKKALEKSLRIPESMQLIYRKNDIFIPINNITQKDCDNFINNYNNRNLYEIIKYE